MVPVEKVRGPTILPAWMSSLAAKMLCEWFEGSWTVVTPKASMASCFQLRCGVMPAADCAPWSCTSIKPGMTVVP